MLSRSATHKDVIVKFELYKRLEVRWHAIVDPETKRTQIYENRNGYYPLFCRIDKTKELVAMRGDTCRAAIDFEKVFGSII